MYAFHQTKSTVSNNTSLLHVAGYKKVSVIFLAKKKFWQKKGAKVYVCPPLFAPLPPAPTPLILSTRTMIYHLKVSMTT
jgi:hypothetical protein